MSKKTKRKKKLTRHHILNRINQGTDEISNIIMLKCEKHQCWHNLFGNKDFREVAKLLLRADRMVKRKGGQDA